MIPPSPDVIVFNGCKENVEISACLQEPTFKNLFLYLYSALKHDKHPQL